MNIRELKPGHYYKAICNDVVKVFKVKELISGKEIELASDYITAHESLVIIRDSINFNAWKTLNIDPTYTIEEIDEKDFYSIVKLFTVAKKSILSVVKR